MKNSIYLEERSFTYCHITVNLFKKMNCEKYILRLNNRKSDKREKVTYIGSEKEAYAQFMYLEAYYRKQILDSGESLF